MAALSGGGGGAPFAAVPASSFAPDFESSFIAPDGVNGPFHGVDGLAAGWRDWLEAWERYDVDVERFIAAGDHVIVFVRISGRTRRDGVEVEHTPAVVWTLRDGVVRRLEFYLDRDAALAAAGLP